MILVTSVCLYGGQHSQQSSDQPGKVTNLACGQLNREAFFFLSPFAPENLVSRDGFCRPVPYHPAHSPYSDEIINLVFTHEVPLDFCHGVHRVIPELIEPRKCVPMAFNAEIPPPQG